MATKKIKIVHIISNLSIGGAQLLIFDILRYLNCSELFEITLITIDSGFYIKKFEEAGIRVIDLKSKGLINPIVFFKLKKVLKKIKPTIVHTHLLKADFYGRIVAKWLKIPVIFSTCHNNSTVHKSKGFNGEFIFNAVDNFVTNYSKSNFIAISSLVKMYLLTRNTKLTEEKVSLIYNGVEAKKENYSLKPEEIISFKNSLNIRNEDFVIVIIGRLEEQKGHIIFLKSIIELISKYQLKIIIVGDGSKFKQINNFIAEHHLVENIQLCGFQPDTQKFFEISNLVVVPSIWEGFGLVACEAMIKGKIVLATRVGGLKEIIDDGVNGFLYSLGNGKELNEKLEYIILNFRNLNKVVSLAKFKVKEKFNIELNAKKYSELYKEKLKVLLKSE